MAYTGQTTASLKAELYLYEVFIRNDCRTDNNEVREAIEQAWGEEPERMKKQLIYVLENSSRAVAEYRIQAAKEQLQIYKEAGYTR